jgi:hypothetical protein
MNDAGEIVGGEGDGPLAVIPPLIIARTRKKTFAFFHTEPRLAPKRVAELADVHKARVPHTVRRSLSRRSP